MRVTINGQDKDLANSLNITALVGQRSPKNKHLIAEINGRIVPSAEWTNTNLKDGDQIELVAFVGGG